MDVRKLRRGFPWATRDVRLFSVTLGGLLNVPLIPLLFCALAPIIFSLRAFLLYERDLRKRERVREERPPYPQVKLRSRLEKFKPFKKEVKTNLAELLSNGIKLAVVLVLIHLLSYVFGNIIVSIFGLEVKISQLLNIAYLLSVIYFGYKIILPLKFFLELASGIFVRTLGITGTAYKEIAMDILYLLVITIVWYAVSPLLGQIPEFGYTIKMIVGSIFLAIFILIFYDLIKIFRKNLKGLWDKIIDKMSETISKHIKE